MTRPLRPRLAVPFAAGLALLALVQVASVVPARAADTDKPGMTTVRQGGKDVPVTKATQGSNGGQGAMSDKGGPGAAANGMAGAGGAGGGGTSAGNSGRRTIGGQ